MTDPTTYSSLLQYGALGLLALFLGGFLWLQHDRDKKMEERFSKEAEARAKTEAAMWTLVNATVEARTAETKAFADLAAQSTAAQAEIAATLKDLVQELEAHDRRAAERHAQVCAEMKVRA
jgi:hypothetical protein